MSAPPKTVLHASLEEEAAIRAAVRAASSGAQFADGARRHVTMSDVAAMFDFFADPALADWIYDLPRPLTMESARAWVENRVWRHERGACVLTATFNEAGEVVSYSDVTVWPEHASAELTGGARGDRQNSGRGSAGMANAFEWMFETLGVRLICCTAALDNVRSQRGIDNAGFVRMGGRDAVRPDGTVRPSVYWEMTREAWRARKAAQTS